MPFSSVTEVMPVFWKAAEAVLREYDACEVRIRFERVREGFRFVNDFREIHRSRSCECFHGIRYGLHLFCRHHRIVTGRLDVQRSEGLRNF